MKIIIGIHILYSFFFILIVYLLQPLKKIEFEKKKFQNYFTN